VEISSIMYRYTFGFFATCNESFYEQTSIELSSFLTEGQKMLTFDGTSKKTKKSEIACVKR